MHKKGLRISYAAEKYDICKQFEKRDDYIRFSSRNFNDSENCDSHGSGNNNFTSSGQN